MIDPSKKQKFVPHKRDGSKIENFRIGSLPPALLALALLAYLAYSFLFPPAPSKPDDTWTRIQNEKVVRIGIDPSSPPFIVDDGKGNLSGFDVALANEMANTWGVKIQWVYTGFDGLYDALNAKQFDLILSALPYNPTKTQDVYFTHAYFNGGPILIVRGDDATTTDLDKLQGRAIAVELGTNGDAVARKWQKRYNLQLRQHNTAQDALRALQKGEVSAAITDPIAFYDFQRAEADTGVGLNAMNWRIVGAPLAGENYIIAVRRDSPTLLHEINAVIDELKRDGRLEELQKENF
ncbi:MAG: amino acid ABC transporter substrate-binding protein [Chloroflexi bacterium]|nr:amino acid ABC transporter substrate-binding protein [Chloroflexota bacterium]